MSLFWSVRLIGNRRMSVALPACNAERTSDQLDAVPGSRILGTGALAGSGMVHWLPHNPPGRWMPASGIVAAPILTLHVGQPVARMVRPVTAPFGKDLLS